MEERDAKKIVDSINMSGYPFQRRIAMEIAQAGWRVDFEYDTRFFPSMYQEERTKVDVVATIDSAYSAGPSVSVAVECKRRDPNHIKWLFFSRAQDSLDNIPPSNGVLVTFCTPGQVNPDGRVYVPRVEFHSMPFLEIGYTTKSYDYPLEQRDNGKKVSSVEIDSALRQVAVGLRGMIRDLYMDKNGGTAVKVDEVPRLTAFMPVVVTSAPIISCSFEDGAVDLKKGIIPDSRKVDVKNRSWLRCSYELPYELRFYDLKTSETNDSILSHLNIWIVASSHAKDFFEGIKRDASKWEGAIGEMKNAKAIT